MRRPQRRVLIASVAGYNRGDDAIAHALVGALRDRLELDEIVVTVLKRSVFREPGVREVLVDRKSPRSHFELARAVQGSSLVMMGGGSIIQDEFKTSWLRGIMAYFAEIAWLASRARRALVTAPIGVDTLHTELGARIARSILGRTQLVAVRDALSERNARALLSAEHPLVLAADPAFALSCQGSSKQRATHDAQTLVLAPAFEANTRVELVRAFAAIAEGFLRRHPGGRVVVLAMDERHEEDGGRIGEILRAVTADVRSSVELEVARDVREAVTLLREASALVTMRLHPMILAAASTPVFCISRGVKTDTIARELAIAAVRFEPDDWSRASALALTFLQSVMDPEARARTVEAAAQPARAQRQRFAAYMDEVGARFEAAYARTTTT